MSIVDSASIVIFGSTGDLTRRKLIPALYRLYEKSVLTDNMPVICIGRKELTKEQFIAQLELPEFLPRSDDKTLSNFLNLINYYSTGFSRGDYSEFTSYIHTIEEKYKSSGNKLFYLALPPDLFSGGVDIIKKSRLLEGDGWKRVAFEKPFGYDLASARELNAYVSEIFDEKQIFRIDHYLGKELVQNIIVMRFANSLFQEIWNNKYINDVQITIAEKVGVGTRGGYYEKSGALRDMVQNHLLQILCLTAMEPPKSMKADDIRIEKVKVLKALEKVRDEDIVLGQYTGGVIDQSEVISYKEEEKISPVSETETFAALRIFVNNKRWQGVPFYIRTGKRFPKRYTEVNLCMKDIACRLFGKDKNSECVNAITIRIQPDEGISATINVKYPGSELKLQPVVMDFCHKCEFEMNTPEAYETLLHQILKGDQTLFTWWNEVEESWKFIEPISSVKNKGKIKLLKYQSGSYGPKEADELLNKDNVYWILPKEHRQHI